MARLGAAGVDHEPADVCVDAGALRAALDMVSEGCAVLDAAGGILHANSVLMRMAGIDIDSSPRAFASLFRAPSVAWPPTGRMAYEVQLVANAAPMRVSLRKLAGCEASGVCYGALLAPRAESSLRRALEQSARDLQRLSHQVLTVQETERQRIAADLHDSLGQSLSAVKFGLETVTAALASDASDDVRTTVASISTAVKDALGDVRRLAMNLRPSMLDDLGVLCTLTWFAREFRTIYRAIDVQTSFQVTESDIHESLKVPIFRVVQEAMNNVAKHSRASSARIHIMRSDRALQVCVEDNGIGFDPHEVDARQGEARRFGHTCARERVEWTGGSIRIDSARGSGVRIVATWALAACEDAAPLHASRNTPAKNQNGGPRPAPTETHHAGTAADHDRRGSHAPAFGIAGSAVPGP